MVGVAQLVRASDCGSEGRRFEPGHSPKCFPGVSNYYRDFCFWPILAWLPLEQFAQFSVYTPDFPIFTRFSLPSKPIVNIRIVLQQPTFFIVIFGSNE